MSRAPWNVALALALLASVALVLVPQGLFLQQSFHESLGMGQVGEALSFGTYRRILGDAFYHAVFLRTALIAAGASAIGLVLALPAAWWLARLAPAPARWMVLLLLVSSFVSIVVKVQGLGLLLGQDGPLPAALHALSLGLWRPRLMHNDVAVTIGLVQYTLPLLVMLLFGVAQTIPPSIEEAARILGASDWRMARRVLLPAFRPGLVAAGLTAFNMNMGAFTSAVLLGGGNVLTVPVLIQRKIVLEVDEPTAAALSALLTLAVLAVNLAALAAARRPWMTEP